MQKRVLAFDPAMGVTGWSVMDADDSTGFKDCVVFKFGSIKPASTVSKVLYSDKVNTFGKSTVSLNYLQEQVCLLIDEFKPDFIAIEDTYLDPRRPTAYASLLQWICAVKLVCLQRYNMPIFLVASKVAKQSVTGHGGSTKVSIQESLLDRSDVKFKQKKQSDMLSEHEADSIAVGFHFLTNILPSMIVMSIVK